MGKSNKKRKKKKNTGKKMNNVQNTPSLSSKSSITIRKNDVNDLSTNENSLFYPKLTTYEIVLDKIPPDSILNIGRKECKDLSENEKYKRDIGNYKNLLNIQENKINTLNEQLNSIQKKYDLEHSKRMELESSHNDLIELNKKMSRELNAENKDDIDKSSFNEFIQDLEESCESSLKEIDDALSDIDAAVNDLIKELKSRES